MLGVALEGGAIRGSFTAGALDVLAERGIVIPRISAVSAGAGCAINYRSVQPGRSLSVMTPERRDRYFGLGRFVKSGKMVDLDRMTREYAYKQFPFDFDTYFNSPICTDYVVTCCETGEAEYLTDNGDRERLFAIIKASCSVPFLCSPVEIDGKHYLDGSLSDSVPFTHLFESGCERVLVIMTRTADAPPTDYSKMRGLFKTAYGKKYPILLEQLMSRSARYYEQLEALNAAEAEGRAIVIRPTVPAISRFSHDKEAILAYYNHGRERMAEFLPRLIEKPVAHAATKGA